jgi:D-alanine transaminase
MAPVPPAPRVSFVNGRYVRHAEAALHVEDRAGQFADAVYEVMAVLEGRLQHADQHLDRLGRSLAALSIAWPVPRRVLPVIVGEVVRRNHVRDGLVYIQASRGVAHRNHPFPADTLPSLVVTGWRQSLDFDTQAAAGVAVVTAPDQRWKRPDIKTVGLLANVLARQSAREQGVSEAWLVDDRGLLTEGAATNAFIVDRAGRVVTHPADGRILGGVTRANVLHLAAKAGIAVDERPFTPAEARSAAEAFLTGTSMTVMPVVAIDGVPVGNGRPGPVTLKLRALYQDLRRPC